MNENSALAERMGDIREARDKFLIKELIAGSEQIGDYTIITKRQDIVSESIKHCAMEIKNAKKDVAMIFGSNYGGKPMLAIMLSDSAIAAGLTAGAVVKVAAKAIQGGGGGTPNYATAGGKNPDGLNEAIEIATNMIKEKLK